MGLTEQPDLIHQSRTSAESQDRSEPQNHPEIGVLFSMDALNFASVNYDDYESKQMSRK